MDQDSESKWFGAKQLGTYPMTIRFLRYEHYFLLSPAALQTHTQFLICLPLSNKIRLKITHSALYHFLASPGARVNDGLY